MTIEEQLKAAILSRYKSIRAFTTAVGIPYSTMDSVIKRGIYNAGIGTMIKVFQALDLDIESVADSELRPLVKNEPESDSSMSLLNMFNQLNEEGQEKLLDYADDLLQSGKYIKHYSDEMDEEKIG